MVKQKLIVFEIPIKVKELESAFDCLSKEQKVGELELLEQLLKEMRSRIGTNKELESTDKATSNPDLTCRLCNIKFKNVQFLKRHVNSHMRNSCELCEKDFVRRRALIIHMKKEHKVEVKAKDHHRSFPIKHSQIFCWNFCFSKVIKAETLYTCEYCNRQFAKKPSLIAHIVSHADEKGKLACVMCGKFYSTRQELESHQEEHQKACKYSCEICRRSFKRKQQYDLHMEVSY